MVPVENFDYDTCFFRILPALPSKHRGEDVRLLKCTIYNILLETYGTILVILVSSWNNNCVPLLKLIWKFHDKKV